MKIELSKPIKANGQDVKELEFREMCAGDLRGIKITLGEDGLTFVSDAVLTVAARLAGVPPSSIDTLCMADVAKITEFILPLLAKSRLTGTM